MQYMACSSYGEVIFAQNTLHPLCISFATLLVELYDKTIHHRICAWTFCQAGCSPKQKGSAQTICLCYNAANMEHRPCFANNNNNDNDDHRCIVGRSLAG